MRLMAMLAVTATWSGVSAASSEVADIVAIDARPGVPPPAMPFAREPRKSEIRPCPSLPSVADELVIPSGFVYPNGIARAADGALFVGQVTDGRVLHRSPEGEWSVFFPGSPDVYAGTSLRLDEGRNLLWGASPDFLPGERARPHRLFALNARTGALERALILPDGGFGNDLILLPDGGVIVTDSRNGRLLELRPGADNFDVLIDHPALKPVNRAGVSGIARAPDGRLIVGNFDTGRLFVAELGRSDQKARLRPLALPRAIENPDGLSFAPDGSLLILEGAVQSGDGKLLRVAAPFGSGPRSLGMLCAGLPSPVNLTIAPDGHIFVTLSRIRHRLIPGREAEVPDKFSVLIVHPDDISAKEVPAR